MIAPRPLRGGIGKEHDCHAFAVVGDERLLTDEALHRARESRHLRRQRAVFGIDTGQESTAKHGDDHRC